MNKIIVITLLSFFISCTDNATTDYVSDITLIIKNNSKERVIFEKYAYGKEVSRDTLPVSQIDTIAIMRLSSSDPNFFTSDESVSQLRYEYSGKTSDAADSVVVRFMDSNKCSYHKESSLKKVPRNVFYGVNYILQKVSAGSISATYTFTDEDIQQASKCE